MAAFKTLDDIGNINGKRVLVRVDLNVPVADGKVTDATRIERVAPTIAELSDKGAKVILLAHFGRPKDGPRPEFSLEPIAQATAEVLGRPVGFAPDCIGDKAASAVAAMNNGDILLLENTRFHKGEEKNDPAFTEAARRQWRHLRQRRLFRRAPRPFLDRRAWRICCRPLPAAPCRPSSRRWKRASAIRSARSSPSSAAPRSRPRSTC